MQNSSRVQLGTRILRIEKRLGSGGFGVVYKVKDEATSRVYALKDILCSCDSQPEQIQQAIREAQTLKQVCHENIIALEKAEQKRDSQGLHMLILTEYCSGGNLNKRLARASSPELNFRWMCQMAAALEYLHSRRVVHRDLKPDNALLTVTEDVKLADFGLAREYTEMTTDSRQKLSLRSWVDRYVKTQQDYMISRVGTPYWMAPEVFKGHYTEKADVFSLGAIFFAILERDFICIGRDSYFGAFKFIDGECVGLGYAMWRDPRNCIKFTRRAEAQGSCALRRITLSALKFDKNDRPSARKIHQELIRGHENPCETSDPGFANPYSGIRGDTFSPLCERGRPSDNELAPAPPRAMKPHPPENSSPYRSNRQRGLHFRRRHVMVRARRFRDDHFSYSVREEKVSVSYEREISQNLQQSVTATDAYSRLRSPPHNSSPSRQHRLRGVASSEGYNQRSPTPQPPVFAPRQPTYPQSPLRNQPKAFAPQPPTYPPPQVVNQPKAFAPQPPTYPQPQVVNQPKAFAPQPPTYPQPQVVNQPKVFAPQPPTYPQPLVMNQPPVVCFPTPSYFQPPMFFAPQPLTYPQPPFMYQPMMFTPHPPTYPHPLFMNWNQPPAFCGFNFFW